MLREDSVRSLIHGVIASWMLGAYCAASSAAGGSPLVFEKDIRPIFKTHCFHCHGERGVREGGLDVRLRRFLAAGGDSGPAIAAGNPTNSYLLDLLKAGDMPQGKPRLADEEIAKIEEWIAAGAPTARPEPKTLGPATHFTEEERSWWSLKPIVRPGPPEFEGRPIDAFVGRRLEEAGLSFSSEADPITLIRRLNFDLIGLPPTPEEIETFLEAWQQNRDNAYAGLVDRLLASPAYGERWARHWLDVAGYADSEGYVEQDLLRKDAYRYRDYVVQAFQEDKPLDEFVLEQLAGDELALEMGLDANAATEEERAQYEQLVTATGFLRMAPDGTATKNDITARNATIADTLTIVGAAFYGLTIQCAQCHDHRYDAITQADYYRLRAVFDPGFDVARWRTPPARCIAIQTEAERAEAAAIEGKAKQVDADRLAKQREFISEVLEKEVAKAEPAVRDALRTAYRTAAKERTPEQAKLLKLHPRVNQLSAGSLYLYDSTYKTDHAKTLKAMADEAAKIRDAKPKPRQIRAFSEVARPTDQIPKSHVFARGDPAVPLEQVEPSDLSVLAAYRDVHIDSNRPDLPTTGRRLALARLLTDGSHPLLARVLVNRVWMHHFGEGIVRSAGDLGVLGSRPTHPDLLDWLAVELMENGWSLKGLHRQIVASKTYRQSSRRHPDGERLDPDNRLLSRQNLRRLEAEVIRDALLAVSGKLNPKQFGPPAPVTYNPEGQVVVGVDTFDSAGRPTGKYVPLEGEEFRRSIYLQVRRSRPLDLLAAFDAPDMTEANCEVRPVTTVSPQSLMLMNYLGMREFASYFAERLREEFPDDLDAQVDRAWQLAYGRRPRDEEREAARTLIADQTAYYERRPAKREYVLAPTDDAPADPELLGLATLCQALASANEFLYVD